MKFHLYTIAITLMFLTSVINFITVDSVEDVDDIDISKSILNKVSTFHNAIGHESHQIVNLVNITGDKIFTGTVNFTATPPVDIIAYKSTSNNSASNEWNINETYYTTDKLLSNLTQGEVEFTGSGLVSHRGSSDEFQMNFTINSVGHE
ncbi:MAG: hypothetical protein ACE5SW_04755 [Nitrososphaeraceae archaeon]